MLSFCFAFFTLLLNLVIVSADRYSNLLTKFTADTVKVNRGLTAKTLVIY